MCLNPSDGAAERPNGSRWSPCIPASLRARNGVIFSIGANREAARVFVRALIDKQLAIEDERAIFPGGARAVLLTGKALYRALGIPDVRHRRGKDATTHVLMRRVLSLDYLIERPTLGWLPTEDDKVRRFEAFGIDRRTFPYRKYGQPGRARAILRSSYRSR